MPNKKNTEMPWERQKNESAQAFEAFRIYLEMGPERSIRAVGQKCVKSRSLIDRWSRTYNWVERCRAWDNHLQQEAKKAAVKKVREMNQRHAQMAYLIQGKALTALQKLDTDMITQKNFAAILRLATQLERECLEAEAVAAVEEISKSQAEGPSTIADAMYEAYRKRDENNEL